VLEQDSFDELADHGLLVGVQLGGGFERQTQVLVRAAFVCLEPKANYYSTKQFFTGGGTVRDWMNGQSFSDQYEFGIDVLRRIENGLPLP
jgi:hypothetical protein